MNKIVIGTAMMLTVSLASMSTYADSKRKLQTALGVPSK